MSRQVPGEQFYKVYTNSDFLKHFDIVREDHKEFVDPFSITLKCKGIKKLLPYEAFILLKEPAQMAKQFYDSYNGSSVQQSSSTSFDNPIDDVYFFQNLMTTTFAPGIMFNQSRPVLHVITQS